MSIESELLEIKGDKELLLVDEVIAWTRAHPNSMLYRQYNWDVQQAAMEHWRWQTRQIIAVNIRYEDGGRRFVSLSIDRGRDGGGYRSLDDVRHVPELREMMLSEALNELQRVQAKYDYLTELSKVWHAAEEVRTKKRGRTPKRAQQSSAALSPARPG